MRLTDTQATVIAGVTLIFIVAQFFVRQAAPRVGLAVAFVATAGVLVCYFFYFRPVGNEIDEEQKWPVDTDNLSHLMQGQPKEKKP